MIMAFSQLQSQGFQSLQLVQSGHAFLDKRHHPKRDGKKQAQDEPLPPPRTHTHTRTQSLIDPPVNRE